MRPGVYRCRMVSFPAIALVAGVALLATGCATEQTADEWPEEVPFTMKVAECSRIADRSERDRCLYGN